MFPQQRAKTINTPSHISLPLAPNHIKIWAHPFITHPENALGDEKSQILGCCLLYGMQLEARMS